MTTENFEAFQDKFNVSENLIFENAHWALSLRPMAPTLGSCVLSLKRAEESFAGLAADEGASLIKIVSMTDAALQNAFGFEKINYLMLMMVDFHVHFHVIPRYSEVKNFAGLSFEDVNWPTPPDLGGLALDGETAAKIIDTIKSV